MADTEDILYRWDRLDAAIEEGRVLRGQWRDGIDGGDVYVFACLLAQLSPEAAEDESASACPAEVMPPWLAEITPYIDDYTSLAAWPDIVRRYADVTRRAATTLDAEGWGRARYRSLAAIVREAASHADGAGAREVCDRVAALCDRRVLGDAPGDDEWRAAAQSATRAKDAAKDKTADEAAAWAAWAATWAAARAAAWAARAAAMWVAARADAAATRAARADAAESAAWDRISHAVLDAIEAEVLAARLAWVVEPVSVEADLNGNGEHDENGRQGSNG